MNKEISAQEVKQLCEDGQEEGWKVIYEITYAAVAKNCAVYETFTSSIQDIVQYSLLKTIQKDRIRKSIDPRKFIYICARNDFFSYLRERENKIWTGIVNLDKILFSLDNHGEKIINHGKNPVRGSSPGHLGSTQPFPQDYHRVFEEILDFAKRKSEKYSLIKKHFPLLKDFIEGTNKDFEKVRLRDLGAKHGMSPSTVKITIDRCFEKMRNDPDFCKEFEKYRS